MCKKSEMEQEKQKVLKEVFFMSLYEYANYMPIICQLSQVFSKGLWKKETKNVQPEF